MIFSFLKNLVRRESGQSNTDKRLPPDGKLRLHIGGEAAHPDWKIFNVRPGPAVDFVGHCTDLCQFADESVTEIYASHVIEHLSFKRELPAALSEFNRILVPGGVLQVAVPDLAVLCAMYLERTFDAEDRYQIMRMLFGGQLNSADFHYAGFDEESLSLRLQAAGFAEIVRVAEFGLFDDSSNFSFKGRPISLNLRAHKRVNSR